MIGYGLKEIVVRVSYFLKRTAISPPIAVPMFD